MKIIHLSLLFINFNIFFAYFFLIKTNVQNSLATLGYLSFILLLSSSALFCSKSCSCNWKPVFGLAIFLPTLTTRSASRQVMCETLMMYATLSTYMKGIQISSWVCGIFNVLFTKSSHSDSCRPGSESKHCSPCEGERHVWSHCTQ